MRPGTVPVRCSPERGQRPDLSCSWATAGSLRSRFPRREPGDGRGLGIERDIDVLFLGEMRAPGRRRAVRRLRRSGIHVEAMGDYRNPSLWGEKRHDFVTYELTMKASVERLAGIIAERIGVA